MSSVHPWNDIGVLVYASIAAIILWLYNSLAIGSHQSFAMLLLVMPVWSLADTSLTTVFLTHGLLLALIIVYILKCISAMEESNFV
ncbi:hypothetical protein HB809_13160 [Listeria booriae]|nr:hypothetical protein [Listeria booriae]